MPQPSTASFGHKFSGDTNERDDKFEQLVELGGHCEHLTERIEILSNKLNNTEMFDHWAHKNAHFCKSNDRRSWKREVASILTEDVVSLWGKF